MTHFYRAASVSLSAIAIFAIHARFGEIDAIITFVLACLFVRKVFVHTHLKEADRLRD